MTPVKNARARKLCAALASARQPPVVVSGDWIGGACDSRIRYLYERKVFFAESPSGTSTDLWAWATRPSAGTTWLTCSCRASGRPPVGRGLAAAVAVRLDEQTLRDAFQVNPTPLKGSRSRSGRVWRGGARVDPCRSKVPPAHTLWA